MGCGQTKPRTITDERRDELVHARDRLRRDALKRAFEALREAGLFVRMEANDHVVHVVADRIEWSSINSRLTYSIDGVDISDLVQGLKTNLKCNEFPEDHLIMKSKPLFVPRKKTG